MSEPVVERRRTTLDVVLGVLLVVGGFVALGYAVVATVVSVFVFAWTALLAGVVLLVSAVARIRSGGVLWAALGGAALLVLGVFILRNPTLGAIALTVLAGALFLTSGVARLVASASQTGSRLLLAISGVAGVLLGAYVLINPLAATAELLGILLGVQLLVEGITLVALGRLRTTPGPADRTSL